jgi:hypothetical protein
MARTGPPRRASCAQRHKLRWLEHHPQQKGHVSATCRPPRRAGSLQDGALPQPPHAGGDRSGTPVCDRAKGARRERVSTMMPWQRESQQHARTPAGGHPPRATPGTGGSRAVAAAAATARRAWLWWRGPARAAAGSQAAYARTPAVTGGASLIADSCYCVAAAAAAAAAAESHVLSREMGFPVAASFLLSELIPSSLLLPVCI